MARGAEERLQAAASSSKERLPTLDEGSTKKGRGLLPVPSRSSSQRQTSPTMSGLSGATAGNPRDSVDGRSKESRASAGTGPTATPGNSEPNTPVVPPPRKKKGGLLALFGCCGVPESGLDGEAPVPNHKLEKIPERPATASRPTPTPSVQASGSKTHLSEKEPSQQTSLLQGPPKNGKRVSATSTQDQSTVGGERDNDSKQTTIVGPGNPVISVEPPKSAKAPVEQDEVVQGTDPEGDTPMPDVDTRQDENMGTINAPSQPLPHAPSPPPVPVPATENESGKSNNALVHSGPSAFAPEAPRQRFLLPPQAPEHRGRKCLVLDLDETLVHSSFKILHQADFTIPVEIEGNYHNVYVIKRPGVDQFMKRVGELYEVVVFTASVSKYGDPLLDQLDIHKVVHHRLFRESCYNHQGNYVKDLSQVGRDLKDTIIIDNSPTSYIFHPQHAVPISSWFSDAHDNELLDLIPVLEDLAGPNVRDVSLVLDVAL
ncbi:hypothetical protein VTJ83DRAFT_305 [Remersonia thermophila]|uniref:FCP1 homology domain-containing protein n=1 Tax=Remersonia thermophila TaxID=72144 RepID=A0ABR4DLN9_9PEZI